MALPLRARGCGLVFDYDRTNIQLGQQASNAGAILVEGQWYCPSMPEDLINASTDYFLREVRDPKRLDQKTYHERLEWRQRYALHPKERPDEDGYRRLACPAVGPSATVSCPRREPHPAVLDRPRAQVLLRMLVNPAPKVCENTSILAPPSAGAKFEQTYPYRSEKWQQYFTTGRQSVESVNKSLKHGAFLPIDDPELRPRRGFIAQLFALATMIVATNVRKIIAGLHGQVGVTTISSAPLRRTRRREQTNGYTQSANAPPAALEA